MRRSGRTVATSALTGEQQLGWQEMAGLTAHLSILTCASFPCSYGADSVAYGYAVGVGGSPSCADAAVSVLKDVVQKVEHFG